MPVDFALDAYAGVFDDQVVGGTWRLYLDRLLGRNRRAARRMIKTRQWTEPGHSWFSGTDPGVDEFWLGPRTRSRRWSTRVSAESAV